MAECIDERWKLVVILSLKGFYDGNTNFQRGRRTIDANPPAFTSLAKPIPNLRRSGFSVINCTKLAMTHWWAPTHLLRPLPCLPHSVRTWHFSVGGTNGIRSDLFAIHYASRRSIK